MTWTPERVRAERAKLQAELDDLRAAEAEIAGRWKALALRCPHAHTSTYTCMGDPTKSCDDCGHSFY